MSVSESGMLFFMLITLFEYNFGFFCRGDVLIARHESAFFVRKI